MAKTTRPKHKHTKKISTEEQIPPQKRLAVVISMQAEDQIFLGISHAQSPTPQIIDLSYQNLCHLQQSIQHAIEDHDKAYNTKNISEICQNPLFQMFSSHPKK